MPMKKCPHCRSASVKRGFRKTNLGSKQTYVCTECKRKFTPEWPRMRFAKKDVVYAVNLYKSGLSSSKIKERLSQRDVHVSRWTIIKWHNKFS